MDLLMKECEVFVNTEDRVLSKGEIIERLKGMDGMVCLLTDAIDGEIMDAEPNLKVISNSCRGLQQHRRRGSHRAGIPVTNTPGVLTETTADFAWALLMAIARRGWKRTSSPGKGSSRAGGRSCCWAAMSMARPSASWAWAG